MKKITFEYDEKGDAPRRVTIPNGLDVFPINVLPERTSERRQSREGEPFYFQGAGSSDQFKEIAEREPGPFRRKQKE